LNPTYNFRALALLRLIRFSNLLIVAISQYLIQYLILIPAFKKAGLTPLLDLFHFSLLVFCTLCIAAAGYIINDLLDIEIDQINKPEKLIIGKSISIKNAWLFFFTISGIGFLIAIYLAIHVGNLWLSLIYPIAVLLLCWYSYQLKKQLFWGNLIVSIFCAFVPGVVLFAERKTFFEWHHQDDMASWNLWKLMIAYLVFAFISTLYREMIKDLEDVEGDRQKNCKTIPIQLGMERAKQVTLFVGILFLTLLIYWSINYFLAGQIGLWLYLLLGIILPLLYTLYLLFYANKKSDFSRLSRITKLIISLGLIFLVIYSFAN